MLPKTENGPPLGSVHRQRDNNGRSMGLAPVAAGNRCYLPADGRRADEIRLDPMPGVFCSSDVVLPHLPGLRSRPLSRIPIRGGSLAHEGYRQRILLPARLVANLNTCGGPGGARVIRCPASVAQSNREHQFSRQAVADRSPCHSSSPFVGPSFDDDDPIEEGFGRVRNAFEGRRNVFGE